MWWIWQEEVWKILNTPETLFSFTFVCEKIRLSVKTVFLWHEISHLYSDLVRKPDTDGIMVHCGRCLIEVFTESSGSTYIYRNQFHEVEGKVRGFENLRIRYIEDELLTQLTAFGSRTMNLQATLQDGTIWLSDAQSNLEIHFSEWKESVVKETR